jgi:hypothetical protein
MALRSLAVTAAALAAAGIAIAVTPVPGRPFIQHKVHPFDLSGKRLRFTPDAGGGYTVQAGRSPGPFDRGEPGGAPPGTRGRLGSAHQTLAFPFPFGGRKWTELWVNYGGNLSFGAPETALFPELETWPAGTMRWVAGALDAFALGGRALAIAPLWNLYSIESTKCYVKSSTREFIATWDAVRYQEPNEGYDSLGRNRFQVRLTPDGAIEMRYGVVAERDGIVGVFSGQSGDHRRLDSVENAPSIEGAGTPRVLSASVEDAGTALHFALKLAAPLPESAPVPIAFAAVAITGSGRCEAGIRVNPEGRSSYNSCSGYGVVSGATADIYISKLNLAMGKEFSWAAGATGESLTTRKVRLPVAGREAMDLSAAHGHAAGNIYEVFHYPVVSKAHAAVFKELYRAVPPDDDLALVMTDFRIDDLFNHGGGTDPMNVAIQGIGKPATLPGGNGDFGSTRLQYAVGPIYLGPRFQEKPTDAERTYRNYAFAVRWMAHELTHRWSAYLGSAALPDPEMLHVSDPCRCHWNNWLHTPTVAPVWQMFADTPYPESSIMGGLLYEPRGDRRFARIQAPEAPIGLSALDLYAMGLVPPDEVPDTFIVANTEVAGDGIITGDRVPIGIADILKASGVRTPLAASSQREFTLGLYLLFDGAMPRPEKLAQARAIEKMLVQYFAVATGGRLKLIAH